MSVQAVTTLVSASATLLRGTAELLAAVPEWWALKAHQAGLSGRWLDVHQALEAQPPAELPVAHPAPEVGVHTTPEVLGQLYVSSLAEGERAREGKHYTPSTLAEHLWVMAREALGFTRGRDQQLPGLILDPACGAGALLLTPLREHLRASISVDPALTIRGLSSRLQGIDQDPWSAWLTNVVLGAEVMTVLARIPEGRRSPIPVLAATGDGLAARRDKVLVSIMNPPYGRLRLAEDQRSDFAHVLYGHANIYGMFMAAGADTVDDNGVLACLVPTSFMAGRYFHKLRSYLAHTMPLHSINFVDGRNGVFAGVLQETCLVTFRRKTTRKVKVTRSNGEVSTVAEVPVPRGENPWLIPRESQDAPTAASAARLPLTLASTGWHASTGPLVWNRRKSDLHARPGSRRAMVLWGADIEGGVLHRDRSRDSMRYLALSGASDPIVMLLEEPAILVQRTTAPEQQRRLVVAELGPEALAARNHRVVVENHINVLKPTEDKPAISRTTLTKVLQTSTMDRVMRCISGSVAVSSYELDSLPLPAREVLRQWEHLEGSDLEKAVSAAYFPGSGT